MSVFHLEYEFLTKKWVTIAVSLTVLQESFLNDFKSDLSTLTVENNAKAGHLRCLKYLFLQLRR
jgi:hypothetical protein